ncbi:hypothetical protein JCM19037_3675 [Geomicrobium sp. JCM 19037]|uniref:DUF7667 family protein n=1 Tax=Geomicrobium sp. JCM 19037 TaxID=1460634 RepID=UPI00045F3615|nr:hypothetical protein [Geomicrobium sp. JCM 19037]GAK05197.1 hypothetical protein JCM19037_3675 [Geomicrobium sp. JCM 19037]
MSYEVVKERFTELAITENVRALTEMELAELHESMIYLQNFYHEAGKIKELMYIAHITEDWDWLHQLCARLDQLEGRMD